MDALRGRLITASFCRDDLPHVEGADAMPAAAARSIHQWRQRCDAALGPASGARAVADVAALPLAGILGYDLDARSDRPGDCVIRLRAGRAVVAMAVTPWGAAMNAVWRAAVTQAIAADARWGFCCNGAAIRVVDARRTWSRDYLEIDLAALPEDDTAQLAMWSLLRADAMQHEPSLLDRAVDLSSRRGIEVCRALGAGVLESLQVLLGAVGSRRSSHPPAILFEHSLTVLYRVLFLLFAEARGLVPMWHPLYRDQYSLGVIVTTLLAGRRYRGLWQAVQAISRLAHAGCHAGELTVTAFNGRLFAPAHAAAFDRTRIDDEVMAQAVVSVSSTPVGRTAAGSQARRRIAFRDLDVEQLGAVYEQVLDYAPAGDEGAAPLTKTRDVRKASGTFYTPRAVTAALVRRTLEPLVRGRSADEILRLRVLDPAMGSGAFLVGTCRYLAAAAEDALVAEGRWHAHDITPADRVMLRRQIAAQCLFGVDLNPMAVQLGRLSLWLATLAADKPLSFLDHHLTSGDSLVGATPSDLQRQPGGTAGRGGRQEALPLFAATGAVDVMQAAARTRLELTRAPDDSAAVVRAKEQRLAHLEATDGPLGRWWRALDLWCAGWFRDGSPLDRTVFGELLQQTLRDRSSLPARVAAPLLAETAAIAARHHFFHWPLAFPEVFTDGGGFDAVIGNPPWDMVRGDSGEGSTRDGQRLHARQMTGFVREAGVYRVDGRAHVNRYQLFVERALQLVRPGGRIGFVLPDGIASDVGAAPLRRHLFEHADVDAIDRLDNREGIFPIHRSVGFVLLSCTAGFRTESIRYRAGLTRLEQLEQTESGAARAPLVLTRRLLAQLSGDDDLGIPELSSELDLRIVEGIAARVPRLGAEDGWHVSFGRELNATDDRSAFAERAASQGGRPIVEGKQIEPFRVSLDQSRLELRPGAARGARIPRRARLAYRDVASSTNRLTLIAAMIPPRAVTTHTLFCLRTPLATPTQEVLCGLLNSFVANYLVRLRVSTHVTVGLVSRLCVPTLDAGEPDFDRLLSLVRSLEGAKGPAESHPAYPQLQALAARLYRLTREEFAHVLSTFPLIPIAVRQATLQKFDDSH